jgi:hypothetical protein
MLDRAGYAMPSVQEVRRLIREHGWAVLVVGSSGDQRGRACSLPARSGAGRGRRWWAARRHRADGTGGSRRLGAALGAGGAAGLPGPQRVHLTRLVRRGSIGADLELHRRARPRDPEVLEGGEAFSVLERTVEHFEAAQDDPWELRGDVLAGSSRSAGQAGSRNVLRIVESPRCQIVRPRAAVRVRKGRT